MDLLLIFEGLLTLFLTLVAGSIIYARWNYGTLEALGIPVVQRSFILGSTPDLHKKVAHFEDIERFKKYGEVYGVYEGRTPQIHICDPELVRLIFVKDFHHFHDRRAANLGDPLLNEMLDFIPGEKWKVVRSMLTPTLTSARIKSMTMTTKEVVTEFIQRLSKEFEDHSQRNNNSDKMKIEVRRYMAGLTIDFLARSSFGIKVGNPEDPNNFFVNAFKEISGNDKDFDLIYNLSLSFPILTKLSPTLDNRASSRLGDALLGVMRERRTQEVRGGGGGARAGDLADKLNDLLDLLETPEFQRLGITQNTVLAQAVGGFFLAAYDSIITVLSFLPIFLVQNPEVSKKLMEEIDGWWGKHGSGSIQFEQLGELEYLGACIQETLRLVPTFIRPERICTKDWEWGGLRIPKGMIVMLPSWAYHRNPKLFTNPEGFDPERWLGSRRVDLNHYGFSSFGFGPRSCVGMRLSIETMKMCLVYILRHFTFFSRLDTRVEYKPGVLFLLMYGPLNLDICPRRVPVTL